MSSGTRKRLLQACFSLLLPVARFLLRAGISHREFADVSRVAFVRVASEEFGLRGRPTNISRVSAMTGISRKDVSRIRQLSNEYSDDLRIQLSPVSDILHYWHTDPEYLGDAGVPKRLSFSDGEQSFAALVKKRVGDLPAGAIRAELIRCGAVAVDSEGLLVVKRRHVVREGAHDKLASSISLSLRSLAETIAFNSSPRRTGYGRIERFVETSNLDKDTRERIRPVIRDRITRYTEELDDLFFQYEPQSHSGDGARVGVGIFYCEDSESS
jgi:Family of unknown function (DUF6502)